MIPLRLKTKKPHKYGAEPLIVDNIRFDSTAEAEHYKKLKLMLRAGEIDQLEMHPKFECHVEKIKVCTVEADFAFWDVLARRNRVQDVKGFDTALSKLKRKLVLAVHGIVIEILHVKNGKIRYAAPGQVAANQQENTMAKKGKGKGRKPKPMY